MENFDDLKKLWQEAAPQPAVDVAEIIRNARKYRRKQVLGDIGKILLLVATAVFIGCIAYNYDSKMITTRIGEICVLVAITGFVVLNTGALRFIMKRADTDADVQTYLMQLKAYRQRQRFIQTTGITVYFILLSLGMGLYFYELTHNNLRFALLVYGLTGAWITFNWLYVRPRTIKKQHDKINAAIGQLERISGQLS